jgi:hypothetical protein
MRGSTYEVDRSQHPVGSREVGLRIRNELSVGRMIHGLDADDFRPHRVVVRLHVFEELELGCRRSHDENLFDLFQRARDLMEEPFGVLRVIFNAFGAPRVLVMDVVRGCDYQRIDLFQMDLEDVSFLVVNPNGYVLRHFGFFSGALAARRARSAPLKAETFCSDNAPAGFSDVA